LASAARRFGKKVGSREASAGGWSGAKRKAEREAIEPSRYYTRIKNLHKTGGIGVLEADIRTPIPASYKGDYVKREVASEAVQIDN